MDKNLNFSVFYFVLGLVIIGASIFDWEYFFKRFPIIFDKYGSTKRGLMMAGIGLLLLIISYLYKEGVFS